MDASAYFNDTKGNTEWRQMAVNRAMHYIRGEEGDGRKRRRSQHFAAHCERDARQSIRKDAENEEDKGTPELSGDTPASPNAVH
jgi:hypothetical protein